MNTLEYGPVTILKSPYLNRLGYYDHDLGDKIVIVFDDETEWTTTRTNVVNVEPCPEMTPTELSFIFKMLNKRYGHQKH